MTLRWRRQPNETGLRAVCQGIRGYQLRDGEEILATVAPINRRDGIDTDKWYWYAHVGDAHHNTAGNPVSLELAKTLAMAWVKKELFKQRKKS